MPEPAGRPLRLGVMCSETKAPAAFAAALRELLRADGVELALVISDSQPTGAPRVPRTLWDAYLRLRPPRTIPARVPVDLAGQLEAAPRIDARDIEAIRTHSLDFVLRLGSGALAGEILDLPTYGVWSFHHSDEPRSLGGPPGFWEIYFGEPATGAILQRLTERPDEGVVLQRCFVSTEPSSYRTTLDAVTRAVTHMPARVARDILHGCAHYLEGPPTVTDAPIRRSPTSAQTVRFLGRLGIAWIKSQLKSVFLLERWHVGIVRRPIESFLGEGSPPAIEWLPYRKPRGFLADPFLAATGAGRRLLMEEWDDRSRKGSIVEVDLEEGMAGGRPGPALGGPTHMAYPFVFERDGSVLCTPETHGRRGVFLYVLDADGGRWKEQATLLEGFAAVDPTLVRHGGRWWLYCTDADDEVDGRLLLWCSPELLGPWQPHPANPVKADIRSSRPAGTPFVFEGELYRPAQDSAGGYGRAVVINRVTRLTTTEYAEEPVARVGPPPGSRYAAGAHTLAGLDDLTAVDGKRMVLAPHLVGPRILRKLARLRDRAPGGGAIDRGAAAPGESTRPEPRK